VQNGIQTIKEQYEINTFDLVLIDGSEFTGEAELNEVYGSKVIILDDANSYKNYTAHHRLINDENYELIRKNFSLRNGYSIFKRKDVGSLSIELPIHFFTIVLNGKPFIDYHISFLKELSFKWHWHIVEGVADLKHDTAWSVDAGGSISEDFHIAGLSIDGTSEYLDELIKLYPQNITVYRKTKGEFWDGKREMVQAPLNNISEECLLWQIDVDEFWTSEQIYSSRNLFIDNPNKTSAYYWCWYFVSRNLVVSTRNCYSQNPNQEWLRTWKFKPGYTWDAHEPPVLVDPLSENRVNIAKVNPLLHEETLKHNLIFQHYAYFTNAQLKFKESYYGYKGALKQWESLDPIPQRLPVFLSDYFPWVKDETMVNTVDALGIIPIIHYEDSDSHFSFLSESDLKEAYQNASRSSKKFPRIAIDGVFFQFLDTGIARVWKSILTEWSMTEFAENLLILDRGGTAPRIPGIQYRKIKTLDYNHTGYDCKYLQEICDEEEIDLFISTYYTSPIITPSTFLAYDFIPEILGLNTSDAVWREKLYSILHACSFITISQNTANDLVKLFPFITLKSVEVAYPGVDSLFCPVLPHEVNEFKSKYKVQGQYFLIVGNRTGLQNYKNIEYFFKAFREIEKTDNISIICTGGQSLLEENLKRLVPNVTIHILNLSNDELRCAYAGAIALVYPSLYEGFGLPVLEAMACGCPVIACPVASIPEVAGNAAIYVNGYDIAEMTAALSQVQIPTIRHQLIAEGLEQAKKFSWSRMAETIQKVLVDTAKNPQKPALAPEKYWEIIREEQFIISNSQKYLQSEGKKDTLLTEYQQLQTQHQQLHQEYQKLTDLAQQALVDIGNMKEHRLFKLYSILSRLKNLFIG